MAMEKPWLTQLRQEMSELTTQAAGQYWPSPVPDAPPYYNFRLEHVRQVERDALAILQVEHADMDTVLAAVWIHDRYHTQFQGAQHGEKAATWARANLSRLGFAPYKVEDVSLACGLHTRRSLDIPPDKTAARLLWDADHLARLGSMGLINFILCHMAQDYLASLPTSTANPEGSLTISSIATLLLERRPAMYQADFFYLDESRRIARRRIAMQQEFLNVLEGQVW